ncbi:protein mono-ADP-ribosyltransferase PARP12-like [Alosa alosa]|uniref:protein mono-ADP-ribosyltransferase PARP12-like n=1 Tax=Alosa alosa TaxID=278164 RepID=UPI0020150E69|nr:protein mono-ADP-ribosyltransferase PARP12-like [Alosa alosa]
MSSSIASSVLTILCQNQGGLKFGQLKQILRRKTSVAEHVLLRELLDESQFLLVHGEDNSADPNRLVIAKTAIRVCQSQKCLDCDNFLHLCRYFVCGNCRFGDKCKNPHSLDSQTNRSLLRKTGLSDLSVGELCSLLLQNDPYLLPEICGHYNKGNGEHGSCRFKSTCTSLHVCQHFLLGDCKFGADCKRAHTFDANSMKILSGRGLSPEHIRHIQLIYKNRLLLSGQRPVSMKTSITKQVTKSSPRPKLPSVLPAVKERSRQPSGTSISEADHNEICLFFIHRGCSFKDKCIRVHHNLPYKWQLLDSDGVTWKDLPDQEGLEKAYCNPASDSSPGVRPVDFLTMTCAGSPVRRLSTASSVTKPPHFILTTEWRWYWKDDQGGWNEYGVKAYGPAVSSVTSKTLEKAYLCSGDSEVSFDAKEQQYIIYLKEMYQQNQKYKTKREVRRRPCSQDVQSKLKSEASETSSSSSADVPDHWDKTAQPNGSYKLVPLSESSDEFQKVEKLFKHTMPNSTVKSIRRIQNRSLWRVFQWQKETMMERSGGKAVEERLLFHGTDPSLLEAICDQNFDWRMCGVHGTAYGKGSYFARDAAYSHNYCKPTSSINTMFVARVLVGEFSRGSSSYVRPPAKGTGKHLYDSCVDNISNPAIFVIFEKYQIYPEFVIEYQSEGVGLGAQHTNPFLKTTNLFRHLQMPSSRVNFL